MRPIDQSPNLLSQTRAPENLRAAVIQALDRGRYVAESEQQGSVIARYTRGDRTFRVSIDYTPTEYSVRLIDFSGYDSGVDEDTGEALFDGRLAKRVRWIERRIEVELGAMDRQAQEAVQAQREHEMSVAAAQAPVVYQQAPAQQAAAAPAGPSVWGVVSGVANVAVQAAPAVTVPSVNATQSTNASHQTFRCCINGSFYSCPGQQAFEQCAVMNTSSCQRQPANDGSC